MLTGTNNILTLPEGAFSVCSPHLQMANTQMCTSSANWMQAWKRFGVCKMIFFFFQHLRKGTRNCTHQLDVRNLAKMSRLWENTDCGGQSWVEMLKLLAGLTRTTALVTSWCPMQGFLRCLISSSLGMEENIYSSQLRSVKIISFLKGTDKTNKPYHTCRECVPRQERVNVSGQKNSKKTGDKNEWSSSQWVYLYRWKIYSYFILILLFFCNSHQIQFHCWRRLELNRHRMQLI